MLSAHGRAPPAIVHQPRNVSVQGRKNFNGNVFHNRRPRRSFHSQEITIDIEDSFVHNGGTRLVERGRGYVKVLVLYDEELRWIQEICSKEPRLPGGFQQLGCCRGGRRTLICSRIISGAVRKLELRLFAPYGRRQMCIPELAYGRGWIFFAELISNFVSSRNDVPFTQSNQPPVPFSSMEADFQNRFHSSNHLANFHKKKSFLQAARLNKWNLPAIRSSHIGGREKCVLVNYDDAVESSFHMARCLVGRLGASQHGKAVLTDPKEVQSWVDRRWKIPGGVDIKEIDVNTFLFIFPSRVSAEERLGQHSFNGMTLFLDRWHSWSCCDRGERRPISTWIRVIGLPIFLWTEGIFKSIGDYCGGHLETAPESIMQTHLKWAKLRVKSQGRKIPSSVIIKVGSYNYDCPIWVERSPWVDWNTHPWSIPGNLQPPEPRRMVAREGAANLGAAQSFGNQRVNSFEFPEVSIKSKRRDTRKVRWIKVGEKSAAHTKGLTSIPINEGQSSVNRFALLNSEPDSKDEAFMKDLDTNGATAKEEDSETTQHSMRDRDEYSDCSLPNRDNCMFGKSANLPDSDFESASLHYPRYDLILNNSMEGALIPLDQDEDLCFGTHFNRPLEDITNIPTVVEEQGTEHPEAVDCHPLAVYSPEEWDWNAETLLLGECGHEQKYISKWVVNRMRSFKKLLGISSDEFEDKIMDLLQSIEEKRRLSKEGEVKKPTGSSRKSMRELKNLKSSITYDKKSISLDYGGRRSGNPLFISHNAA